MSTTAHTSMPVFSTASALETLWHKASARISLQEMEWFASGASMQVGCQARALSQVLEETGCLVAEDEGNGCLRSADGASNLLFNLQNQLDTIAGLAEISMQANAGVRQLLKDGARKSATTQ